MSPAAPKTTVGIALEEAIKKNGGWHPNGSEDEAQAEAVRRWENEGGRIVEEPKTEKRAEQASENIEEFRDLIHKAIENPPETPAPNRFSGPAEAAYRELAEITRRAGVKPEDLDEKVWKGANAALDKVKRFAQLRSETQDKEKIKQLDERIRQATASLVSRKMREKIEKAARETLEKEKSKVKTEVAGATDATTKVNSKAESEAPHPEEDGGDAVPPEQSKAERENLYELYTRKQRENAAPADSIAAEPATPKSAEQLQAENEMLRRIGKKLSATEMREPTQEEVGHMAVSPEDVPEHIRERLAAEGTRSEMVERLKGVVRSAQGKLYEAGVAAQEKIAWWKSSEEHLVRRSAELDAEAAEIGWVESEFRKWGERYNKVGWKTKLAVGLALGIGAGLSAPVSMPMAAACLFGVAAQRILGLSTMYLKYEKVFQDQKWGKERAMLNAIGYSALMTAGTMYAVQKISDADIVSRVREWLADKLGHQTPPRPEVSQPMVTTGTGPGAEIPPLTVHAAPGQGYEYMLQRMWEQLQDKGLDPNRYPEGSDIRQLLETAPQDIDKVVHQLASDPSHGFFRPDGTSAPIGKGDILAFNTGGQILHINPEGVAGVHAAIEAPVPVYHPEVPTPASAVPLPEQVVPAQDPVANIDLTPGQQAVQEGTQAAVTAAPPPEAMPREPEHILLRDSSGNPVTDSSGNPVRSQFPEHAASIEAPIANAEVVSNQFGLAIPVTEPHIYGDEGGQQILVYGGTPQEQLKAMQDFLIKNPGKVVFGTDPSGKYRIPWGLVEGELSPIGQPVRTSGFFGFFSSFMEAPGADELKQLIK
ncbi:TPA: hypothetical protein DIV48_02535 [Candidatus Kaiserbacteria bacterium]|nr:MAG: hypothetical protein UY93_C0002G0153 [Parcubacteria group bacterium GW2011_GWA1_56_13]HCR52505.1 hypothetical protein [Candidatus Kaiserbacteria bacterium]